MCRVLFVSKSGYLRWISAPASQRRREDDRLGVRVQAIHAQHRLIATARVQIQGQQRGLVDALLGQRAVDAPAKIPRG